MDIHEALTEEELKRVENKTFFVNIKDVIYIMYTDSMEMYLPYLEERFTEKAKVKDLLEYAKLHNIQVFPVALFKSKTRSMNKLIRVKRAGCYMQDIELIGIVTRYVHRLFIKAMEEESKG